MTTNRVIWDGVARTAEMTYNSISEDYGNGGNYISSLKPGESITGEYGWIVNENDLNNMYLNLNGDGAAYEFSDSMLKNRIGGHISVMKILLWRRGCP